MKVNRSIDPLLDKEAVRVISSMPGLKLKKVYCNAEQVPAASTYTFGNIGRIALYVPEASMEVYKATTPWSRFGYIMKLSQKEN